MTLENLLKIYSDLMFKNILELHYKDMQDIEFILLDFTNKKVGFAAIKIALMIEENLILKLMLY